MTLVDGRLRTAPEDCATNLRAIVRRLSRTGARLVFATTTPVPGETTNPSRREADARVLDRIARAVMAEAGVSLNDLHACAAPRLAELRLPANVHFRPEGSRALGERVAGAIRNALLSVPQE